MANLNTNIVYDPNPTWPITSLVFVTLVTFKISNLKFQTWMKWKLYSLCLKILHCYIVPFLKYCELATPYFFWDNWGVFTKLCNALYDQLTRRRSHKLILLTNYYIALGCVARALSCVAPHYATHRELRWYTRTGPMNSIYEHLCERPWWKLWIQLE